MATAPAYASKIQSLEDKQLLLANIVDQDHEWINGNGKKGAKATLEGIDNTLVHLKERIDGLYKVLWWTLGIFGAVFGSLLIYLITNLLPKLMAHVN